MCQLMIPNRGTDIYSACSGLNRSLATRLYWPEALVAMPSMQTYIGSSNMPRDTKRERQSCKINDGTHAPNIDGTRNGLDMLNNMAV